MPANQKKNHEIVSQLKKYLPQGCLSDNDPVPVKGAGCWYQDADGKRYLDFTSGVFTNSFGHRCEAINQAAYLQADCLANIHGRHSLAELHFYQKLFPHLPSDDYKAIPYNDGGYTIDRGLTDLINYYDKKRIGIGAFRNGFHGKTQASKLLINETESAALYHNFQLDFPNCYRCPLNKQKEHCNMECVKAACQTLKEQKARAILFEPIQGAGIIIPPLHYWSELKDFCRREGIIMFADEVLTGGGRTGDYLASSYFHIVPDMIALTKGLANGKPLSVLLEREFLTCNKYAVRPWERSSTFAAHPEALAAAAKLLELIEEYNILENVRRCGEILQNGLLALKDRFRSIGDVRSIGLMAAVEFVSDPKFKTPYTQMGSMVFQKCRYNGLEVIQNNYIIRLAPPLNINASQLRQGLELLEQSIAQVEASILT
ncbi:MAG: aminotransferase class III-fold pyridoxal phosphate-dependent enzyme [Eubacterium sp.]|nr:aminotransferase class III-fold pyridoxal phosphate-dependent enzyme [Eubacterium sp.]